MRHVFGNWCEEGERFTAGAFLHGSFDMQNISQMTKKLANKVRRIEQIAEESILDLDITLLVE
jgi:hypothetical protein